MAGRRGGAEGRSGEFAAVMGAMRSILVRQPRLMIQQSDSSVTVSDPDGGAVAFATDGQDHDRVMPGDVHATTNARWDGDRLVVDSKYAGGLEIDQTFTRDPDSPSSLLATVQISGLPRGGSRTFRVVYDPAASAPTGGS